MIPRAKLNRDAVARMAGVSSATVSRVYNHPEQVDEATARKVRKAAEKVGYVLDKNASALRRRGSGVILFCQKRVPDHRADRYYKWFYADVLLSVIARLDETPYRLRIQQYENVDEIKAAVDCGQADAIIGYGIHDPATVTAIGRLGVPYVCGHQLGNPAKGKNVVVVDERRGGAIAGAALRDAGLRRPAHITGELNSLNVCQLRWKGFQDVFQGCDIPLIDHGLGIMAGREAAGKLLPLVRKGKVDAVFVVNDLTALGVVQVLLENGVRIPEDLSVVAYDNLPFIDALSVKLTTVDIDLGGLYRVATDLLLDAMRTGSTAAAKHSPFLVPGESVRKGYG
jgi:DNA-binding LacI/PurR family transcriptional regulator